jgi:hypothetical protein
MLGWIEEDLVDALDIDVVMIFPTSAIFGNAIGG